MAYEELHYAIADQVATITLNRPDKLNALTHRMENELFSAIRDAHESDQVRVIVLTGAGKGFCSGADISLLQSINEEDFTATPAQSILDKYVPDRVIRECRRDFQRCWTYFLAVDKPIIAAINGPAVGLGFILSLFCDIRYAAENARFSTAFAKRGLIAEHGISWLLPRLAGLSNAFDLLYSARIFSADEALRMNLVSRVLPQAELMGAVHEYAQDLAQNVSPRSLKHMKRELTNGLFQSLTDAIDDANRDMLTSFTCDDFREGVAHFVEKRPARFTGK